MYIPRALKYSQQRRNMSRSICNLMFPCVHYHIIEGRLGDFFGEVIIDWSES